MQTVNDQKRDPMPRVDPKRKLVAVFSSKLRMWEVRAITNKGLVSKMFAPEVAFTEDVRAAFRRFSVPFAGFRAVPGIDKAKYGSWNEFIEGVWDTATKSLTSKTKRHAVQYQS